jgi:hypothetical protein
VNNTFKRAKHIIIKKLNEARTINVEPNWEGVWRFFKYIEKTDPTQWSKMKGQFRDSWIKLQRMADKKGWKSESVNEGGTSLPGNVKRFMEKFVDALEQTGLNRKRKMAVLAGIIDALDIEPGKIVSMVNKIKSGQAIEGTIKEGANKRLGWMDDLIDQLGSEKKVLEEVFRALSDKEAKEVHDWIMRHWS